jgi:hypothetical protein
MFSCTLRMSEATTTAAQHEQIKVSGQFILPLSLVYDASDPIGRVIILWT